MIRRKLFLTVFALFFAFSSVGVVSGQKKGKTRKPAEPQPEVVKTTTELPQNVPVVPETILGVDDNAALAIMYSGEMRGNLSTCG
jgi:hypothetical protein